MGDHCEVNFKDGGLKFCHMSHNLMAILSLKGYFHRAISSYRTKSIADTHVFEMWKCHFLKGGAEKKTLLKKYHFSAGFNHFDLKFSESSWDTGLQKCIKFHKLSMLSSGEVRLESQTCNF